MAKCSSKSAPFPSTARSTWSCAQEAASTRRIRAIIDRTLPLREAAAAHRVLEEERVLGKIILDPKGK